MAENEPFDQFVSRWLEEMAPARLPERVLNATFERTRKSRQHVGWRALLGRLSMPRFLPALGSAAIIVVVAALALNLYVNQQGIGVPPTPASPHTFTEIARGEMVEIPDWPLTERTTPPSVVTGTELIVWGDGTFGAADDGAAFDLAKGTWRVIAEAPLSPRSESAMAWTGAEMIVWGGRVMNTFYYDGAAYNPVTDTWRSLAPEGFFGKDPIMVWTGDEAVVFGAAGDSDTTGEYLAAAAYDPVADTWRTLANAPASVSHGAGAWWTGDSILVAGLGYDFDTLARYDLAADQWTILDIGSSVAIVGVPGTDGRVTTFLSVPSDVGAPTQLIDTTGSLLTELPALPADPGVFRAVVGASGIWVGEEALFEIWNGDDSQPEQIWALNPGTQRWRRLDTETAFPRIDGSVRVAGDLLLTWNRPDDVNQRPVCCVAPPSKGGSIYRIGTTVTPEVP